jgi:eukaryotic-like serine/threonine-protein kinase
LDNGARVAAPRAAPRGDHVNPERWQYIKVTLHAALELTGTARAAYVAKITANDPELRLELESLIAAYAESADSFLNVPAAAMEDISEIDGSDPWVGKRIGPYQLIEQVGSGGMGEVYRAIRVDDEFQKQVAIKLIRVGEDSAFVVQRFRNERQILASFEHPNIARLLDGGTTGAGLPYFAMEFIQGEPIDVYCDRHKLDTSARLRLFLQVCSAVQYAHQRLIIHRDLKPNNILVDADGIPKLLDFGIAKILQLGERSENAAHTKSIYRMLTPGYASPEQAGGNPITTSSDVYSLGVILYELLTGRKPHLTGARPTEEPRRPSAVVRRYDGAPGTPADLSALREGSPRKLARRLRGDLDNIVLMALRVDPLRRYESVEQFAEDLRRHLSSRPVIARKDTLRYRAGKFFVRYAIGVAATVAVVFALLAALLVTARETQIAQREREREEHRFNDVRKLAHSLIFDINDSVQYVTGSSAARHLIVKTGLQYLDSLSLEATGDPSLQRELAAAYERMGDVQGRALEANEGDYSGAAASYRHALTLREAIVHAQPQNSVVRGELVVSYGKLSDLMWSSGKADDAIAYSQDTVANSQILAALDPQSRNYQLLLASSLLDNGFKRSKIQNDIARALGNMRRAIASLQALQENLPGDQQVGRTLSLAYSRAAEVLSQDPKGYAEALTMEKDARTLIQSLAAAAPDNADLVHLAAFADHNMSDVLIKMQSLDEAESSELAALKEFKSLSSADPKISEYHFDMALSLGNLAKIALLRGQTAEALADLQQAVSDFGKDSNMSNYYRSVKAVQQKRLAEIYESLATNDQRSVVRRIEDWHAAKEWYEKALALYNGLNAASPDVTAAAAQITRKIQVCDKGLAALNRRA